MSNQHHGMIPLRGAGAFCTFADPRPGRFARLLPQLPPLYVDPALLKEIGRAGGEMEDKGKQVLTDGVPAGLVFLGQFIDHDLTLDISSSLTTTNDPQGTENVRTPTLDLDCVYGDGPEAHPYLYRSDRVRLATGADYAADPDDLKNHDLPRTPNGTAIIGDHRNDENRLLSQLQLGFLRFHNAVVDAITSRPHAPAGARLFEEARRVVTWHYQWIVVNDFLRTVCGDCVVDDILTNGRKIYRPHAAGLCEPFIPIEFSAAAYRFGHTMIPQRMRVRSGGERHDLFGATLGNGFSPVTDMEQVVEWRELLDDGDGNFERAGKVDAKLAQSLLDLPFMPPTVPAFERSLAVRNLLRGQSFLLPSGEQIAYAMIDAGVKEIEEKMIGDVRGRAEKLGLRKGTPFWLYILIEGKEVGRRSLDKNGKAEFDKGEGLGPVGARFVAETIIGLLELDRRSYLGSNRSWSPDDPADRVGPDGVRTLYQLLTA